MWFTNSHFQPLPSPLPWKLCSFPFFFYHAWCFPVFSFMSLKLDICFPPNCASAADCSDCVSLRVSVHATSCYMHTYFCANTWVLNGMHMYYHTYFMMTTSTTNHVSVDSCEFKPMSEYPGWRHSRRDAAPWKLEELTQARTAHPSGTGWLCTTPAHLSVWENFIINISEGIHQVFVFEATLKCLFLICGQIVSV